MIRKRTRSPGDPGAGLKFTEHPPVTLPLSSNTSVFLLCASANPTQGKSSDCSENARRPRPHGAPAGLLPEARGGRGACPRPPRAPVAMGTHGARPPERDAGGGAAADPVGDAVARWRLRGREMRSERAPPGTARLLLSPPPPPLRRRVSACHCAAAQPSCLAGTAACARSA